MRMMAVTRWIGLVSMLVVLACLPLKAQEQPASETAVAEVSPAAAALMEGRQAPEKTAGKITMADIMGKGGWLMKPIAGLSLLSIALLFFYLMTMRRSVLFPKAFMEEAENAAATGDLEGLHALCLRDNSVASKIIDASVASCREGKAVDYARLRDAMEDEGGRQAGILWQRLQYLMDVAVIAPMVGLLGTVWGMMISFTGLESGVNMINKADALANGVAQAMYTTFGGLIVGIFSMAMYDIMRGRLNGLISSLESGCSVVLRKLAEDSGICRQKAEQQEGGK